jgi:cell division transport system permease protein
MAIKIDYLAKETVTNLSRNLSLTIASILTVAVSLSMVGSAILIGEAVRNATARWEGGIEFIVFLQPEATPEQTDSVRKALSDSPEVEQVKFVDQAATFKEFKELFKSTPQLVENVDPAILPPSYRVVPVNKDADAIASLGEQFRAKPGVKDVVFAADTIKAIQRLGNLFRFGLLVVAGLLLLAAIALILNTIRMAMFARRREIEVMKLVGASNWFIRIPFMFEGITAGVLGSSIAVGATLLVNKLLDNVSANQGYRLLRDFTVDSGQTLFVAVLVFFLGVLIGAAGSGFAVTRYLDV